MKNKITFFFLLTLCSYVNLSGQWILQQVQPEGGLMICLDFTNINHGAMGGWLFYDGYGEVTGAGFHTFNGGVTWSSSSMPDSVRAMTDIKFTSELNGYAIGAYNPSNSSDRKKITYPENVFNQHKYRDIGMRNGDQHYKGIVLKTTDGGVSWFTFGTVPDSISYLESFQIVDSQTVFVCTSVQIGNDLYAGIAKTDLNFRDWSSLNIPLHAGDISRIRYVNNSIFGTGYKLSGKESSGIIVQSNDMGITWTSTNFFNINNFMDVRFVNGSSGFVTGIYFDSAQMYNSCIYKTTNKGATWMKLNVNLDSTIVNGMETFQNQNFLIFYGKKLTGKFPFEALKNILARSNDLGNTWSFQNILHPQTIMVNCQFISPLNGYCIGSFPRNKIPKLFFDPVVLKTTNGGSVFINSGSEQKPEGFSLEQNFPNPFNPVTVISYQLAVNSFVFLKVFDLRGKEVAELVNQKQNVGKYSMKFDGSNLSSGIYFYKLEVGDYSEVKKMILMK